MASADREFDLVLFGASGFTGRLVAEYLAGRVSPRTRTALAGRSAQKVTAIRDDLGANAARWDVIEADSGCQALESTFGPYLGQVDVSSRVVERFHAFGFELAELTGADLEDVIVHYRAALDAATVTAVCDTGLAALAAVGFDRGVAHTELRLTAAGPRVVEINPRPAGNQITELVRRATGVDLPMVYAQLALGIQAAEGAIHLRVHRACLVDPFAVAVAFSVLCLLSSRCSRPACPPSCPP